MTFQACDGAKANLCDLPNAEFHLLDTDILRWKKKVKPLPTTSVVSFPAPTPAKRQNKREVSDSGSAGYRRNVSGRGSFAASTA